MLQNISEAEMRLQRENEELRAKIGRVTSIAEDALDGTHHRAPWDDGYCEACSNVMAVLK